ncbi:MAG: sialidase family protein [Thermoplasmatota archaeon]
MRVPAALLLALAVAGCTTPPLSTSAPGVAALTSGWSLDCSLGAGERALGHVWPQSCEARATHTQRTKAEPWVAVNPKDPQNVVVGSKDMRPASSANCVWNGLGVTHDGGRTWKDVTIGGDYASRQPGSPFYGFACNTDAMFAFDASGALHFGVEMYNLAGSSDQDAAGTAVGGEILLATSLDGGLTWPQVVTYEPPLALFSDYSRMAVSPISQTILEVINNGVAAGDNECHVLSSRDGGKSMDPPVLATVKEDAPGLSAVTGGQESPTGAICRAVAVNPKTGVVVIGWKDDYNQAHNAYFSRSTDDGLSFVDSNAGFTYQSIPDPFPNMKAPSRAGQQFEVKYDRSGTLWAITAEAPAGDANVYVRHSADDGRTWSNPVQVNDPLRGYEQWMPQIAFGADGSVHAFFFDRGYSAGKLVDVTHARSLDGGRTWATERVTNASWDPDLGRHQSGVPWIGDYIGADAVGNDVWAAVPDTSLGGEPVLAAIHVVGPRA